MKPESGQFWRHRRTGHEYYVSDVRDVKLNGEWIKDGLVNYREYVGGSNLDDRYARLTPDFLENFDEVTE